MLPRVLCAFDSPASARLAVPSAVELAAWEGAELVFLAVLPPHRRALSGAAASRAVPARAFLELALARAGSLAERVGLRARLGLVVAADLEREALAQAVAQGAHVALLAEERGFWRRPWLRRVALAPAGARSRLRA